LRAASPGKVGPRRWARTLNAARGQGERKQYALACGVKMHQCP